MLLRAIIALQAIACIAFGAMGGNYTDIPLREPRQKVFHIHISKVGLSFDRQVSRNIKQRAYGAAFSNRELFLTPVERGIQPEQNKIYFSSVMLRDPKAHVVSLFNHCVLFKPPTILSLRDPRLLLRQKPIQFKLIQSQYARISTPTPAFKRLVKEGGIKSWLQHFVGFTNGSKVYRRNPPNLDDLGCYEPINFQSRFVVTSVDKEGNYSFYPPTTVIDRALQAIDFVGLLEYYTESHCLFGYQVTGTLPPDCSDPCARLNYAAEHNINITHGYIPDTSVSDLDGETLKILNQLTIVDAHLYAAAVRRFRLSARVAGISLEPCRQQPP